MSIMVVEECDCRVVFLKSVHKGFADTFRTEFCPTHKHAEEMRDWIYKALEHGNQFLGETLIDEAVKLLEITEK